MKMKLHLLVTKEMMNTMPETVEIIFQHHIDMVVYNPDNISKVLDTVRGENMILEDTRENFIKWLKPFDGVWVGTGVPQHESFQIMHIKDED